MGPTDKILDRESLGLGLACLFFNLATIVHYQCDHALNEEALAILGPNDKVLDRESLGLGLACFFYNLATINTLPV